jgi:hypothetical protein
VLISNLAVKLEEISGIAPGDDSQTPLQFVYQAADCKIFHKKGMTVDVTSMGRGVADVGWGGASCVVGDVGLSKKRDIVGKRRRGEGEGECVECRGD